MGQGRRKDFGEFTAKLEKHIEKLPDYAQRAQEKLQRYIPPSEQGSSRPAQPAPPRPRPQMPQMPAMPKISQQLTSMAAGQIPVVADAKAKWARWNEPAAKLERRKRRASRALTFWILLTFLCGLFAVVAGTGLLKDGQADVLQAIAGGAFAVIFGTFGVKSGLRLRTLNRTVLPAAPATPPPLPPARSVAREPMERLAESEASLAELLRQLSQPTSLGTMPVSEIAVADARTTAAEAAQALRGLAGRIQAIERGRDAAPERERGALDAAIKQLRDQLDDGLDGYGGLVAAAGHTVAASSDGLTSSKESLSDATDKLAGLAMALRELS
ncbi:phage shock envelope stress response protein PspM [Amycolatopsis japonica]|uniref:phage shock envelope stress response protein PspM n=1 Tax=Amycolatopsis japonica TaxID=208439 RepID=UPI0033FD3F86